MGFNYRGVHVGHPAHAAAKAGVIVPGDVAGTITPEQHTLEDVSAISPFTSWTPDRNVAVGFASQKGPGGLVLRLPTGEPRPGDTWRWVASDDAWMEDEILLFGVRMGAEVTQL